MECLSWIETVLCFVGFLTLAVLFVFSLIHGVRWILRVNKAIGRADRADKLSSETDYKVFEKYNSIESRLTDVEQNIVDVEGRLPPKSKAPK